MTTRAPTPRPRSRKNRTPKARTEKKQAARFIAEHVRERRRERDYHERAGLYALLVDAARAFFAAMKGPTT